MDSGSTHRLQQSFSGGEISSRMLLRHDLQVYQSSLLQMLNWVPTIQGTAERAPGSRFILDTGVERDARIIPYRSVVLGGAAPAASDADGQIKGILQLTENVISFKTGIPQIASLDISMAASATRQIVVNSDLGKGQTGEWEYDPPYYIGGDGETLGMGWAGGFIRGNCRIYKYPDREFDYMDITTTMDVDVETDTVIIEYALALSNFFTGSDFLLTVKLGTTDGGDDVYSEEWRGPNEFPPSSIKESASIPGGAYTGLLYMNIHVQSLASSDEKYSQQDMALNYFRVWAAANAPPADVDLSTTYLASELADIHFIASPYDFGARYVKPIVFVHPKHPPSWFFWDGDAGDYAFEAINFGEAGDYEIPEWGPDNYPTTCTAVQGRLVLGGTPVQTEAVWMTRVAQWNKFDDIANVVDVTPKDSIEFTSIYRSAIKWLSGHKNLLVGTEELEYIASADGIFQPSDLGVAVQTTHGGAHVQPAGFGPAVMFAAEAGQRVRETRYSNDESGWIAADMTIWHPDLFSSGIIRMVRMRNPHQMLVVVMGNGQIALFHQDSYAQVSGWSRLSLNAKITDACVLVDENGADVLYVLVQRKVNGQKKLYIEAFANWTDFNSLQYVSSHVVFYATAGATNIITGLDHLEGVIVQVVGDEDYLGTFVVRGGEIILIDQIGAPIPVLKAVVGTSIENRMVTLPTASNDPSSKRRYTSMSVRVRGSTNTIINGERPSDRRPQTRMNTSEPLDFVADYSVSNLGFDSAQFITIEENVPFRSEVLAIFGKLKESST